MTDERTLGSRMGVRLYPSGVALAALWRTISPAAQPRPTPPITCCSPRAHTAQNRRRTLITPLDENLGAGQVAAMLSMVNGWDQTALNSASAPSPRSS